MIAVSVLVTSNSVWFDSFDFVPYFSFVQKIKSSQKTVLQEFDDGQETTRKWMDLQPCLTIYLSTIKTIINTTLPPETQNHTTALLLYCHELLLLLVHYLIRIKIPLKTPTEKVVDGVVVGFFCFTVRLTLRLLSLSMYGLSCFVLCFCFWVCLGWFWFMLSVFRV